MYRVPGRYTPQEKALLARSTEAREHQESAGARVIEDDRPEAVLLRKIQRLAREHGWKGEWTWGDTKDDPGLHCWLVRGTELIRAEVRSVRGSITVMQQALSERFATTGKVECYVWRPHDMAAITARLAQAPAARLSQRP